VSRFIKRCWLLFAILVICLAIVSSFFRALTPWARQYKSEVEQHLSALLGQTVVINSMETGWYWFEPVIRLQQISVSGTNGTAIKLDKLLVGIDLFQSLWSRQIQPGILYLDGIKLTLRQSDNQWHIDGLKRTADMSGAFDSHSWSPVFAWILAQQKILIKNVSGSVYWQDGSVIPIKRIDLAVLRKSGRYRINGRASLDQKNNTVFRLLADMDLNPYVLNEVSGDVYVSVKRAQITQWQRLFPQNRFDFGNGFADIRLWFTVAKGAVVNAQSRVDTKQFAWQDTVTKQELSVPKFTANLAWNKLNSGWKLAADQIELRMGKTRWPENKILIEYQTAQDHYSIYARHVLVESMLSVRTLLSDLIKPELQDQLHAFMPRGNLDDAKLSFDQGHVSDLLSGFHHLGWQAQATIPGVDNLSGVIHWSANHARLALDSEKVILSSESKPPVTLSEVNTSIEWNKTDQNASLVMDHLVIKNPDLLLSANVTLANITADSPGTIDGTGRIALSNAEQWMTYIPSGHLKAKLEAWLKKDVKKIETLQVDSRIQGNLADFPFDKSPGEFWVKAYTRGVDLVFAPGWPLAEEIEAYVRVDKRQAEASIVHANLQGTQLTNGNMRIADLGLNRETLLFHTKIHSKTQKALAYILSSPLAKKLSALSILQMHGALDLDLKVEAPLYPENDDVLALGDASFSNNQLDVKHGLGTVQLKELNGGLQFDQAGILDSNLKALFMDYPVTLLIQSLRGKTPSTQVKIKGKVAMDTVRARLKLPIFDLIHGNFWVSVLLTLTDEPNDLDHITVSSSLTGVAIDLPPPLGKVAGLAAPLKVDVDFNPEKAMRFRIDYDDRMNGDLWFSVPKGQFQLQKGEIRLGSENALRQKQDGLQIVGELAQFDLQQWLKVAGKLSGSSSDQGLKDSVHFVGLMLRNAKIGNQTYRDMAIKALKLKNNLWSVEINQALVKGVFRYNQSSNALSGTLDRLYLEKQSAPVKDAAHNSALSTFNPADLPALDLTVNSLKYNELNLGKAQIKTTPLPGVWRLDSGKIISPWYQLTATGQWTRNQSVNETKVDATLTMNQLAKSLERWKITPVVDAEEGRIQFQGGWPGSFHDFSLASMSGQMSMVFENGRITNLSPETEEKLGLGKLLSILSLQTIPRRLKLDFSDLSHKGYSFDQFKGNFSIAKGLMNTSDSFIDGPIAYASMKGSLDIDRQLYDLNLRISPHVTASLPIVATIAGGPIAGIATWIASKIINQGMQKVSGYTYKISGPWKQPVVTQTTIIRKKIH